MLKSCLITLFLAINFLSVYGQASQWKDHLSYRNCKHVAESDNFIAVTTDIGLMTFNKTNNEISTYSRINGLSDIGISAVQALPNDQFIIGYTNGNIDIISSSEVINIPDLKNKQIRGEKQINHFHIKENIAYCSTGFALLLVNIEKYEITDTYYIGINSASLIVYESFIVGNDIYAATDRGLLNTQLDNSQIANYEVWEEISGSTTPSIAINYFNNELITIKMQALGFDVLYGNKANWTKLKTLNTFESLTTSGEHLLITQSGQIERFQENLTLVETIEQYNFDSLTAVIMQPKDGIYSFFEEAYFIADQKYGLVKKSISKTDAYIADGPYSNNCTDLHATKLGVYSVAGSPNQNRPLEYSYFNNSTWSFFTSHNTDNELDWIDVTSIGSSKIDDSHVYFSSWGSGLFQQNEEAPMQYGVSNNGLQAINGSVKVGGLASDHDGNIWMTNVEVESGLVIKSEEEWHRFDYQTTQYLQGTSQMLITKNNFVWMTIQNSGRPELLIINPKETLKDDSDDEYRGPITKSAEPNEDRNKGRLKLWNENQEIITNTVLCIAEDKNEYIWLGTDKGILVYYNVWSIFNDDYPIANRIKVPRNDGSNLADYLLENERVSCIAVDGANRKWIGTEGSGVYLVSDDGLKTYHSFNITNSPLPSNNITSIAISPGTGDVFIGTDQGIVSYKGKATEGENTFKKVYAYPNPVREDFNGDITITGLMQDSQIKITTTSGRLVHETRSLGGKAYWNGTNFNGEKVKSGVYLVYVSADEGQQASVTKILIIR